MATTHQLLTTDAGPGIVKISAESVFLLRLCSLLFPSPFSFGHHLNTSGQERYHSNVWLDLHQAVQV